MKPFAKILVCVVFLASLGAGSAQAVDVMAPVDPAREPSARVASTVEKPDKNKAVKAKKTDKRDAKKKTSSSAPAKKKSKR